MTFACGPCSEVNTMFKSLMIAGSIALGALAMSTGAEARSQVGVYFGVPFYDTQAGPNWRYSKGYGWYDYGRYGDFNRHNDRHSNNSNFTVYFGVPFYSSRGGPGWRYYDGYGWYDYNRYGEFRGRNRGAISCGAARRMVDDAGFDRVRVVECNGRTYTFRALNRRGNQVMIYVDSRSGAISRG